jgi:hypothetical protein
LVGVTAVAETGGQGLGNEQTGSAGSGIRQSTYCDADSRRRQSFHVVHVSGEDQSAARHRGTRNDRRVDMML